MYLFRTHKQLRYNLHLKFITGNCYRLQKRNKKKKKDKVHKNTIVYILTIKRRLPIILRFYFHDVLEPTENYISYKFRFKRILGFVIKKSSHKLFNNSIIYSTMWSSVFTRNRIKMNFKYIYIYMLYNSFLFVDLKAV